MPVVSYPVLRCVLEHIEANCRLSLSARCPEISRIEKSIPLRVNQIGFMDNGMKINDIEYRIFSKESKLVLRNYDKPPNQPLTLILYNLKSERIVEKMFLKNYGVEVASRKVLKYLLGGRRIIRVNILIVPNSAYETMQYLFGISNLKVSALESWGIGLEKLHSLIGTPLNELRFEASHPTDFGKPIVRRAEKILVRGYRYNEPDIWLETHRNLPNKEVVVNTGNHGFSDISFLELIEYWIETSKPVGSSFSILNSDDVFFVMFLKSVKQRFQGTDVNLKEADKSIFTNMDAVSIKVDSKSEIVVYGGLTDYEPGLVSKVVIKMMAVGSTAKVSDHSYLLIALLLFGFLITFLYCLTRSNCITATLPNSSQVLICFD
ncbi:unnamed protein product [Caenorhabditis nigoni]